MRNDIKVVSVGKGLKLYRLVRTTDNFDLGIAISGNGLGGKLTPWTVRWKDMFSTTHTEEFRTMKEALDYVKGAL